MLVSVPRRIVASPTATRRRPRVLARVVASERRVTGVTERTGPRIAARDRGAALRVALARQEIAGAGAVLPAEVPELPGSIQAEIRQAERLPEVLLIRIKAVIGPPEVNTATFAEPVPCFSCIACAVTAPNPLITRVLNARQLSG